MADSEGAVAPAVPASETPPAAEWRLGGFAVATGLVVSAVIHLVVVGTVLVASQQLLQSKPADDVSVDLITPEELAALSSKTADAGTPKPSTPPAEQQPPAAPAQPQAPLPALASADAYAMPFLPKPAPSAPAKPDPPLGQASQLAALVGMPTVTDGVDGGDVSEYQAKLTAAEIAAFTAKVQSCWAASADLANEPRLYVVLRVRLRRDGGLATDPALVAGAASTLGPALFNSAKHALRKCAPYGGLPAAKYDEWQALDLRFTAGGLAVASPVSNGPARPG